MSKFRKPDVHVYLLQDIQQLGVKGEIILVPSEAARKYLLPFQLAYYVPRHKGKPILPPDWEPKINPDDIKLEKILPAYDPTGYVEAEGNAASAAEKQSEEELKLQEQEKLKELKLHVNSERIKSLKQHVKKLEFLKVKIGKDTRIYGSISVDDITAEIKSKFSIIVEKSEVTINDVKDEKIKSIGVFKGVIRIEDIAEEVYFDIVVKDATLAS
ncbi:hypothetical protein HK099_003976 [Clydaea vesicula]|uniref:50S ribosomal protein L9, chloroplastic n=1 Tax=Clydaea vesicula TaxID=447962 RepID=A0AAD5U755_9FUNG|nr:hypothetical protein HK099_003976 [Clydaea vesicula]